MPPEDVAQLLYGVGFRGEDLVNMVAIAGRESGYRPEAHRTDTDPAKMVGDFGLFQINYINDTPAFRAAIGMTDRSQLLDPQVNARAAYYLYERGGLAPWTAGPGGWTAEGDPTYGTDVAAAREAVARAEASGMIDDPFDGGPSAMANAPDGPDGGADLDTPLERFLKLSVAQAGDPYDSNHGEPDIDDPNPTTLDCSELVQWAAHNAGVEVLDGSYNQHFQMIDEGATVSIEEAMNTPGALLFSFDPPPVRGGGRPAHAHVAISLGDGRTIEAQGSRTGILIANANADRWTNAAVIPEFKGQDVDIDDVLSWTGRDDDVADMLLGLPTDDSPADSMPVPLDPPTPPPPPDPLAEAQLNAGGVDTDIDMLPDHFELKYGLDPNQADTDGDGITDGYELIVLGTEADLADSDFDGIDDGLELSYGLNPLVADNPDVDAPLVAPDDLLLDSDGDGIADWGEDLAGTDPNDPDSDDDGVLDGDELMEDTDPLTAG
ncbi:MAG: NlpC/P60 family protein [Ilumatobacteraceae bacterium]